MDLTSSPISYDRQVTTGTMDRDGRFFTTASGTDNYGRTLTGTGGQMWFHPMTSGSLTGSIYDDWMYLDGVGRQENLLDEDSVPATTILHANLTEDTVTAFSYAAPNDGSIYLSLTQEDPDNVAFTSADRVTQWNSTLWAIDDDNYLYTYCDGSKYYVNINGPEEAGYDGKNPATTSDLVTWKYEDNMLQGVCGTEGVLLVYDDTKAQWRIIPALEYFFIYDEQGHYMNAEKTNYLSAASILSDASNLGEDSNTKWYKNGTAIYTTFRSGLGRYAYYYLEESDGSLTLTGSDEETSSTAWYQDEKGLYCKIAESNFYLTYENGAWTVMGEKQIKIRIQNELVSDVYMTISDDTVKGGTADNATEWTVIYTDEEKTKQKLYDSASKKYLSMNTSDGTIELTSNRSDALTWTQSTSGDYVMYSFSSGIEIFGYKTGTTFYLTYDQATDKWLGSADVFYTLIQKKSGNYLTWTGSGFSYSDRNSATKWVFSSSSVPEGTVRMYGYANQYLSLDSNNSLTVSGNAISWKNYQFIAYSNRLYATAGNKYYYIKYDGGWGLEKNSTKSYYHGSELSFTNVNTATLKTTESSVTIVAPEMIGPSLGKEVTQSAAQSMNIQTGGHFQRDTGYTTYFPIRAVTDFTEKASGYTAADFAANESNTGYIVSSGYDNIETGGYGDIRVTHYSQSDSTHKLHNSYDYESQTFSEIYTISLDEIGDAGHDVTSEDHFVEYNVCAGSLLNTFKEDSYYYGLHFMNHAVGIESVITADNAQIGKTVYTNYDLPASSIDFYTGKKGYVAFMAGTNYYNGKVLTDNTRNNCFFTLSQVFRNDRNEIVGIRQISEIYKKTTNGTSTDMYIYKYTADARTVTNDSSDFDKYHYNDYQTYYNAGNYGVCSGTTTTVVNSADLTGYTKVFDMAQVGMNNNIRLNAIYYFEIPVNPGEYALGCVDSGDDSNPAVGANLLYLDISTNSESSKSQEIITTQLKTTSTCTYPKGVCLLSAAQTGLTDELTAASCVTYSLEENCTAHLKRTGDTVQLSGDSVTGDVGYLGGDITLKKGSEVLEVSVDKTANYTSVGIRQRTLYRLSNTTGWVTKDEYTYTETTVCDAEGEKKVTSAYTLTEYSIDSSGTVQSQVSSDPDIAENDNRDTDKAAITIPDNQAVLQYLYYQTNATTDTYTIMDTVVTRVLDHVDEEEVPLLDDNGNQLYDDNGNALTITKQTPVYRIVSTETNALSYYGFASVAKDDSLYPTSAVENNRKDVTAYVFNDSRLFYEIQIREESDIRRIRVPVSVGAMFKVNGTVYPQSG